MKIKLSEKLIPHRLKMKKLDVAGRIFYNFYSASACLTNLLSMNELLTMLNNAVNNFEVTALYARLSKDDMIDGESNSVTNQKRF